MTKTEVIRMVVTKEPQTVRQVADLLDMAEDNVAVVLRRLADKGKVKRVALGKRVSRRGGSTPYIWGGA